MIYLKSVFAGLAAVFFSFVLFVLIALWPMLVGWQDTGAAGIGFVMVAFGPVVWMIAALIFVGGFWWQLRRLRRPDLRGD